jgi:hypothetical protein
MPKANAGAALLESADVPQLFVLARAASSGRPAVQGRSSGYAQL